MFLEVHDFPQQLSCAYFFSASQPHFDLAPGLDLHHARILGDHVRIEVTTEVRRWLLRTRRPVVLWLVPLLRLGSTLETTTQSCTHLHN